MISMEYLRNPITAPLKLGWDAVTGNLKSDGNKNTPYDYVAPVVNTYVDTKKSQLVPKPAQEWAQETIIEPAADLATAPVKVVTDALSNGVTAITELAGDGFNTVKKYAPLIALGVGAVAVLAISSKF